MKKYRITYKEVGRPSPGYTYYTGDKSKKEIVSFFGLDKSDIEWYIVELINE